MFNSILFNLIRSKCIQNVSKRCNSILLYRKQSLESKILCNDAKIAKCGAYSLPFSSSTVSNELTVPHYLSAHDKAIEKILCEDMIVFENFLSQDEEESLMSEIEPQIKRIRYQNDHWDDAIHGYRETERKEWNSRNQEILKRVREVSFAPGTPQIDFTHVLDLKKDGYIKPHVDSIRFCGRTIAGLCLLSPCVMRLALEKDTSKYGDILLNRKSLYVMKDKARYDFTHEVLAEEKSYFKGNHVPRDRRVSVICRNEPE